MKNTSIIVSCAFAFAACKQGDHGHPHEGEEAHGHPHEQAHASGEDHEHERELPRLAVTLWTAKSELFMEHDPFVVGQEVGFAVHLTILPSFKAVRSGTVTVTLSVEGHAPITAEARGPSSPGIFRPVLKPAHAGPCTFELRVEGRDVTDRHVISPCVVYADRDEAYMDILEEAEPPGRIPFLKEQQWVTEFATAAAIERELQPSVLASGEIRAATGSEARITAPAAGRLALADPPARIGDTVEKGLLLGTIAARLATQDRATVEGEVRASRAEVEAAEAQLARNERLLAQNAVAARAVEEAKTRLEVARAQLSGASSRLSQHDAVARGGAASGSAGFQLRAPIAGTIVFAEATAGQVLEEGAHLFTVIDLRRVWLEARVFEPDIPKVEGARSAWFRLEGYDQPFVVGENNGRVVTIGRVIDPRSRTVPVIFEVDNPDGTFRIGQFAKVGIAAGAPRRGVAIPEIAIVEESGRPTAYVQLDGEAFTRRPLRLGTRDRGWVEVLEGVAAGERVVTKGAYEIKLSAASGVIPAHGHAH